MDRDAPAFGLLHTDCKLAGEPDLDLHPRGSEDDDPEQESRFVLAALDVDDEFLQLLCRLLRGGMEGVCPDKWAEFSKQDKYPAPDCPEVWNKYLDGAWRVLAVLSPEIGRRYSRGVSVAPGVVVLLRHAATVVKFLHALVIRALVTPTVVLQSGTAEAALSIAEDVFLEPELACPDAVRFLFEAMDYCRSVAFYLRNAQRYALQSPSDERLLQELEECMRHFADLVTGHSRKLVELLRVAPGMQTFLPKAAGALCAVVDSMPPVGGIEINREVAFFQKARKHFQSVALVPVLHSVVGRMWSGDLPPRAQVYALVTLLGSWFSMFKYPEQMFDLGLQAGAVFEGLMPVGDKHLVVVLVLEYAALYMGMLVAEVFRPGVKASRLPKDFCVVSNRMLELTCVLDASLDLDYDRVKDPIHTINKLVNEFRTTRFRTVTAFIGGVLSAVKNWTGKHARQTDRVALTWM
jgi:hypothetical protein